MTTTMDKTSLQSIIRLVDNLSDTANYDTIISVLSLLCLFSILNRPTPQQSTMTTINQTPTIAGNPIQKLLGDLLGKSGENNGNQGGLGGVLGGLGGLSNLIGSPDLLMSLLPLLNNPQLKSKINPSSIASVMGIINNLSGMQSTEKSEPQKVKEDKAPQAVETVPAHEPEEKEITSPIVTPEPAPKAPVAQEGEKKPQSRFLNWKTNF